MLLIVAAATVLAACGTARTVTVNPRLGAPHALSPLAAPRHVAHLGETLNLTNQEDHPLAVALLEVIDPAPVESGPVDAAKVYVAAKFTVVNTGNASLVGDANNNAVLVGSDNRTYAATVDATAGCSNFNAGIYQLNAGDTATGCVTFALPVGVTPLRVRYMPSAGFAGDVGVWAVQPG